MSIRKMTLADLDSVETLFRDTWPHSERIARTVRTELKDMFSSAEYRPTFYVAECDKIVVGCGAWNWSWLNYGIYELCWCVVQQDRRGRGLGRALVEYRISDILQAARSQGERGCTILTSTHLCDMYGRYGFVPVLPAPPSALEPKAVLMALNVA